MLELKNVKKTYKTRLGEVVALNGVSITFPDTGMVFITGKSGCGKTTLLNVIGGLDGIDGGDICVQGKPFSTFSQSEYDDYRNTFIGFVFQEYNLLPEFTVEKNIKLAMELQGSSYDNNEFNELLNTVEIASLVHRKPNELSGGQRQRVAIARALIKNPRIIMADEPTGALDSKTGVQVFDILKKLSKDKLIIVVSHDEEFAKKYADRIIRLVDGNVIEDFSYDEKEVQFNVKDEKDLFLVRDGADLDEKEKDALALAIKNKKKIKLLEKLTYREKRATGKVEAPLSQEPVTLKKSKMKFKSSFAMGMKSLSVKPLRLIFTILLSAIAFAVFGLFDTVSNFSTAKVLSNVLKNSPYPTITSYGQYIIDQSQADSYDVKLTDKAIEEISSNTGFQVKGVYNFDSNISGFINNTYPIYEIKDSTVSIGTNYYTKYINGVVEFSEQEIDKKEVVKGFNYKIIGSYPTQIYSNDDSYTADIAISTYIADSIMHYLNGGTMNSYIIEKSTDLINKPITIKNMTFKIVGLIDCGEIPEKYDMLKDTTASQVDISMLAKDFFSYINSGAFKYLFVPDGFKDYFNSQNKQETVYSSGDSTWTCSQSDRPNTKVKMESAVYSVDEFTQDNVLMFSGEYPKGNKIELKDDEVLIHIENIRYLYHKRFYEDFKDTTYRNEVNSLIGQITDMNENPLEPGVPMHSIAEKRGFLQELLDLLCTDQSDKAKPLKITKRSNISQLDTTKTVKVVGVYFDVEPNKTVQKDKYRLMMNKNLMQDFDIYSEQGDYSRILIIPTNDSGFLFRNSNGINVLARYMTNERGFTLNWYGNSSIDLIQENEGTIRQSAGLFLYVALALALFSMFMFFNYIVTSIVNKRPSIGVLRGLGSGRKDILRMFICESIVIALINAVIATVLTAVGCIFVNMYINNVMNIVIPFAIFGIRQVLIIFGMSLFTAAISSSLPIIKITKEKPVDLIRKP